MQVTEIWRSVNLLLILSAEEDLFTQVKFRIDFELMNTYKGRKTPALK